MDPKSVSPFPSESAKISPSQKRTELVTVMLPSRPVYTPGCACTGAMLLRCYDSSCTVPLTNNCKTGVS